MYPHHMLNKDVLGGGIYLRKLPDLSFWARPFRITSFWGTLGFPSGALPSWEPQSGDPDSTPEVLSSC